MGRPRIADLPSSAGGTAPDLLPDPLRLLIVGINPSLWTAATGAHFARPGNRFYPALARAGILDRVIDASAGYRDEDRQALLDRGIGITNLVARATARADELSRDELMVGAARVRDLVADRRPQVLAVVGVTAYRKAFGQPGAKVGRQPEPVGTAALFVVPNPSGLNAGSSLDDLAARYREAAVAAGLV